MIDVKNITDGPKVLNTQPPVVLLGGEEREDLIITAAELRAAQATGYFEFDGEPDDGERSGAGGAIGDAIAVARREFAEQSDVRFRELQDAHAEQLKAETERADAAEKQVGELQARITELEKEAADRGLDPELVKAAVEGLDPKNDEHWTQAGLPEVAAVKAALGADVTRAQIAAAAPEAKRPTE